MNPRQYEEKQQKEMGLIESSRPVAFAKTKDESGAVVIVAVYEMGTEYKFFFRYTAKTLRTPRKKWTRVGVFMIHQGRETIKGQPGKVTLNHYLQGIHNIPGKWTIRYPHKKKALTATIERVTTIQTRPVDPASTFGFSAAVSAGRRPTKQDRRDYRDLWNK